MCYKKTTFYYFTRPTVVQRNDLKVLAIVYQGLKLRYVDIM